MIRCVDLFCGIGGLTHGLTRGGIRVVAGVDVDGDCRFPYEKNNKAKFIERSVRDVKGDELRAMWKGNARTLLAGCAPCQPFSTYSRGKGITGGPNGKWGLVRDFGRLVTEAQPDLVTMENVPRLGDHPVYRRFLSSLDGYSVWCDVVDCASYGVPQTRKRLVLLASRLGPISLIPPTTAHESPSVRKAISHLAPLSAGEVDSRDRLHAACNMSALNLQRIKASIPGGTWRDWDPALVAACHRRGTGATYPSVYGRMVWDAPAPTITTQSFGFGNGRFGHPDQDRAITLREAAMLQTFPDDYQFLRKGERVRFNVLGRLIGNAVPVKLGEVLAETFTRHVESHGNARRPRPGRR